MYYSRKKIRIHTLIWLLSTIDGRNMHDVPRMAEMIDDHYRVLHSFSFTLFNIEQLTSVIGDEHITAMNIDYATQMRVHFQ